MCTLAPFLCLPDFLALWGKQVKKHMKTYVRHVYVQSKLKIGSLGNAQILQARAALSAVPKLWPGAVIAPPAPAGRVRRCGNGAACGPGDM